MSFSIDNLNSSAISFVLFYERPLQTELSPPTLFPEDEAVGRSALGHVEKAQARNSKLFQQPLLHILLFNHCQLLRFHLPPVSRENASLAALGTTFGALPAAASCCSSAASSTASVQYAKFFSGLPAPRRDL